MNLGWLFEPFISKGIILVCLSVNKDEEYNFIYLFLLLLMLISYACFLGSKMLQLMSYLQKLSEKDV